MPLYLLVLSLMLGLVYGHSAKVPHLTEPLYDALPSGKAKFIMFYAPWCPHCMKIMPLWERMAEEYPAIYAVNCEEENTLRHRFGIQGFPTFMYVPEQSEKAYKFFGNRTSNDFVDFMNGGWQRGNGTVILKEIDHWALMLDELLNPMVLGAVGVVAILFLALLVMCICDKKEEERHKKE